MSIEMEVENKGIYVTATDSATPDLMLTQSLQALPLKRKPRTRKHLSVSVPEKEEVERLDLWTRSGKQVTAKPVPGPEVYRGRFSDLDRILTQRKAKSLLPPLARQSQGFRGSKLQTETSLREQARYAKIYEDEVEAKLKETEKRLKSLLNERDSLRDANSALKKALEPVIVREKEVNKLEELVKRRRNSSLNILPRSERTERTVTRLEEKSEAEKAEIRQKMQANSSRIEELGKATKAAKQLLRSIKAEQVQHYSSLLREGTDTRSEGLSWVVRTLWSLGRSTPFDTFPCYLEAETVKVVLTLAEKYQQVQDLTLQSEEQAGQQRRASFTARAHPDRWNQVQDRLRSLGHNIISSESKAGPVSQCSSPPALLTVQPVESEIQAIRSEIAAIQAGEVRRLMHESCFHRLEQRLGVSLWRLLGAVMGVEVVSRQMSWITKEQNKLLQEHNRTKTYCFG